MRTNRLKLTLDKVETRYMAVLETNSIKGVYQSNTACLGFGGILRKCRVYGGPTFNKLSGPWTTSTVWTRFKAARDVFSSGKIGGFTGGGVITVYSTIAGRFCIDKLPESGGNVL